MHSPPAPLETKSVWQECWRQPKEHRDYMGSCFCDRIKHSGKGTQCTSACIYRCRRIRQAT